MADEIAWLKGLLKEARACLVLASAQEGGDGLFTLGRMNSEKGAVVIWDRIGSSVRMIDSTLRPGAPPSVPAARESVPDRWWACLWCRQEFGHFDWCPFRPGGTMR